MIAASAIASAATLDARTDNTHPPMRYQRLHPTKSQWRKNNKEVKRLWIPQMSGWHTKQSQGGVLTVIGTGLKGYFKSTSLN